MVVIQTCLANKSWSSAEICTPKRCDAYAPPENATVTGNIRPDNFTFGETLNITCNPGYLSNNKTVVTVSCTSNGTWGPIVKCEPRTCPNFTAPANTSIGSQVLFGRVYGETINVTCNNGFNQVGHKEVMCREDGTWSPSPSCIQCSGLNIPNATVVYQTSKNASISCREGFNLTGPAIVFCKDDGNWTEAPRCVPVDCGNISNSPYETLNYTSTVLGSRAYLTCGDGFQLIGRSYIECGTDGKWNQTGTCEPRDCGNFTMPEHSFVVANGGKNVNATIHFNCTEGFTLATNISNILTCSSNGSWIGGVKCVSKVCEMFVTPNHSTFLNTTTSDIFVGETLNITCNPGYLSNNKTVVTVSCTANGTWGPIVKCEPRTCPNFTAPANTSIGNQVLLGRVYGATINVTCNDGFNQVGNKEVTCREDGTWSPSPSCIQCSGLNIPNATVLYQTSKNASISCRVGFNLTGPAIVFLPG